MQLTMTGEYAIRTMLHLANLPPGNIAQISEISRKWDIPETFLRKIVAKLSRGGLVASHRGIGGGLSLSRPAEEITLLQIVEEMEGPMALNRCLVDPHVCTRSHTCSVHNVWAEAQGMLRDFLSSRALSDLLPVSTPPAAVPLPGKE